MLLGDVKVAFVAYEPDVGERNPSCVGIKFWALANVFVPDFCVKNVRWKWFDEDTVFGP
jgi:hypothetical protein